MVADGGPRPANQRRTLGERLGRFTIRHGARRRAIAVLGLVSAADFFVPALPTQSSVVALGLMQPRRAAWIALAFALAAVAGAGVLAGLLHFAAPYAAQFSEARQGEHWRTVTDFIRDHGALALLAASALPTPPRLLTAAALLAGVPTASVLLAIFSGRLIWFGGFLALLVKAPDWLGGLPVIGDGLRRFRVYRDAVLAEETRG